VLCAGDTLEFGRLLSASEQLDLHGRASSRESQRDSVPKPRVGASRLPWGHRPPVWPNPNGVVSERLAATPLGLKPSSPFSPRVARASSTLRSATEDGQPWALGQNPFGISSQKCPDSRGWFTLGQTRRAIPFSGGFLFIASVPQCGKIGWYFRTRECPKESGRYAPVWDRTRRGPATGSGARSSRQPRLGNEYPAWR